MMPRIHLMLSASSGAEEAVRDQVRRWSGRVAIVAMPSSVVSRWDLDAPVYSVRDLVPIGSDTEERVYREVALYRKELAQRLASVRVYDVPLADDFAIAIGQAPQYIGLLAHGARALLERGFDHVAIVLEFYTHYHVALLREAIACGLAPADAVPLQYRDGSLEPAGWLLHQDDVAPVALRLGQTPAASAEQINSWGVVPDAQPGGTVAVLATSVPLYTANVARVIRALEDDGGPLHVVSLWPAIQEAYRQQYGIESGLLLPPNDAAPASPVPIAAAVDAFFTALRADVEARLAPARQSLAPDIAQYGARFCDFVTLSSFHEAAYASLFRYGVWIERLHAILTRREPFGVYCEVGHSEVINGLAHLARAHGARSVTSVFASISSRYRDFPEMSHVGDFVTVLGEDQVDVFLERNYTRHRVVPVGQPDLDEVLTTWSREWGEAHLRERVPGYDPAKRLLLVATSSIDEAGELQWIERLGEIAAHRGDAQVILKLHPSRDGVGHIALCERRLDLPLLLVQGRDEDIHPYLAASDVVLTDISHAGKLAVYHGRPLCVVNFTGTPYALNRFDEDGVALLARTATELRAAMTALLDDPDTRANLARVSEGFVRRYFTANDGGAATRTASLLLGRAVRRRPARPARPPAPRPRAVPVSRPEVISSPNVLVNPNLDTWADGGPAGWVVGGDATRVEAVVPSRRPGGVALQMTHGQGTCYVVQRLADVEAVRGKHLRVTCWVWSTAADTARLQIGDSDVDVASQTHAGDGHWRLLTADKDLPDDVGYVDVYLQLLSPGTAVFDEVTARAEGPIEHPTRVLATPRAGGA